MQLTNSSAESEWNNVKAMFCFMIEKASDKNKNRWKIPRESSFWRLAKCKNASANKETNLLIKIYCMWRKLW